MTHRIFVPMTDAQLDQVQWHDVLVPYHPDLACWHAAGGTNRARALKSPSHSKATNGFGTGKQTHDNHRP